MISKEKNITTRQNIKFKSLWLNYSAKWIRCKYTIEVKICIQLFKEVQLF